MFKTIVIIGAFGYDFHILNNYSFHYNVFNGGDTTAMACE